MRNLFLIVFTIFSVTSRAQSDSLFSLSDCERIFLKNNLNLLAAKFNVNVAQAAVIQARLWDNPSLSIEINAYNPDGNKFFDVGVNGDKSFGIEQLIHLGSKRHNELELARTNVVIAQLQFSDLLRNLKQQLRESYFAIYYDNLSYQAIVNQMESLNILIQEYEKQVAKGNISMKDLVRLKSLYLDFRSKKSELFKSISDNQSNLSLLVGKDFLIPQPKAEELKLYSSKDIPAIDSLYHSALNNRPDYQIAEKQVEASAWNLKWQKSLVVPDVSLGANYSQRAGAFPNALTMSLSVPLALWNRNQGNIKSADAQMKSNIASKDYLKAKVMQDVVVAQKKWKDALENSKLLDQETIQNFKKVSDSMFKNFEHGNVSLIEFTDFLESYTQSILQYNQLGKNLVNTSEDINFYTSSTIF
ncbi:MAG: TolC family protein [Bacteroidales bacterium]